MTFAAIIHPPTSVYEKPVQQTEIYQKAMRKSSVWVEPRESFARSMPELYYNCQSGSITTAVPAVRLGR